MLNKVCRKALLGISCLILVLWSSCRSTQNAVYFSDIDSISTAQLTTGEFKEPIIQNDDLLSVSVQTMGQNAFAAGVVASTVSSSVSTQTAAQSNEVVEGFLVSKAGTIEMPMLGVINVAGLTTIQAKEVIRTAAKKYYKDPTVQVRIANFKITILGEVAKPASYTVPYERVTVIDAIAMAGDITLTGKKDNILLLRENGGKKDVIRLNLNAANIISSPYFYLKQNDVLYVEPTKTKVAASNARNSQGIAIGISLVTLFIALFNSF